MRHEGFGRNHKDLKYGDHSRQNLRQTLAILGELHSQDVEKIQHDISKTYHHSFGKSLQVILQAVSIITKKGGDVSSTIC